jgi:signal transduction histidine kinase/CheY-like chemotaxis protein
MQAALSSDTSGSAALAAVRLQAEQVQLLCRNSQSALVGSVLSGVFVAVTLLPDSHSWQVSLWFALLLAISVVRGVWQRRQLNRPRPVNGEMLGGLYLAIAVNGLIWALPSIWLEPKQPEYHLLLGLFLVGTSAAALGSLASLRYAYSVFLLSMMLPIAASSIWNGGHYWYVAIGILAYTASMVFCGHRLSGNLTAMLQLQLDNAALACRLQREKDAVEQANRDLQAEIKQREQTEAELRVAKVTAEAASRAKNQFLANMSHELRTPLNSVLGMSDLLLRSLASNFGFGKAQRYAQSIRTAGERLLHLIDDILDMARIEAGALRFENAPFDPRRLIAETVEPLIDQCAARNLHLAVDVAADVPHELRSDPYRLRQVLSNLLGNAIKFTEHGSVTVRLSVLPSPEPRFKGMRTHWEVIDTGIGIGDQARARLFQPFSQADESCTRKFGGTGLGLAICRQIVSALGGRIDLSSSLGRGSTFWFDIPMEIGATGIHTAAQARPMPTALHGRVLIADDNLANRQLAAEILALAGCQVGTANDGSEALRKLSEEYFDLVLMDWHMPDMDGVTATRVLRAQESQHPGRHLPVVALTASVLPGDRETCLQAGMDDFVAKPFTYDELVAVVSRWLPLRK